MIILQTASGGGSGYLGLRGRAAYGYPPATTFRSNAYIHRLNRTLQAEMRVISAYRSLNAADANSKTAAADLEAHQLAGKELVRLIIANRGIPEDRTALSLGLTRTLIKVCTFVPSPLGARVAHTTLRELEKRLARRYEKLISLAPARDIPVLTELLHKQARRAREL